MNKKSPARLAFEALPFHEFLERAWSFVRNPEITGENLENSSLRYAGHNFIASLFLVTTFLAFIQYLLPELFDIDFGQLVNPVYLSLVLAVQAIVFAFILAIVTSIALLPQRPALHHLIVHQALQVYAVVNFLIVVMFWIGINRILKTGDIHSASGSLDLWLGGGVAIVALYFSWRLLFKPLWKYISKYYANRASFGVMAVVIAVTLWANSYAVFGFSDLVINKPAFCKQLYEQKKQRGEVPSNVDEQCFIGHCMSWKENEP